MSRLVIFLDAGGVINDLSEQMMQFQRLVGAFFAPLLGETSQAWSLAHSLVTNRLTHQESASGQPSDYLSFYRASRLNWVKGMYELLGIAVPSEEECLELAYRALTWITRRAQVALPGAVETIHTLHKQGYRLHTASGSCSIEIAGSLEGMKVEHCFGRLYGADLINTFKEGPQYYRRIFADLGILPAEALVVDDSPRAISWAAQTGARTVLVSTTPHPEHAVAPRIGSLSELPGLLSGEMRGHISPESKTN